MKLEENFQQLQNHPVNEQLQHNIRMKLDDKKPQKQWNWLGSRLGEFSFVLLLIALGSFLLFTSLQHTQQAASNSIQAIYSYQSEDSDLAFRAKPSTNYIGMENVTTESLVSLFENINELPTISPTSKMYGDYEIIIVYEDGEQRRFEFDSTYLYDVDKKVFYPGYGEMPAMIYSDLFAAHHSNKLPIYLMPLLILALIGGISVFYNRRKIELPQKNKSQNIAIAIYTVTVLTVFYYVYNIGLLYFPLLLLIILALAYLMWWAIKRAVTNPLILRVEKIRIIALVIIVVVFLIWG
ncbi:hypothetical protein LZ480_06235 [Solibacillus sp. MA9]|uniref:DUF1189 domain-containing protein n=1 Tax=Solibacillus palustris TaxID=2908203 RepID=A0ABS9UBD7_9BACL|nr:hypothetical protein [Solibacillus sp. MA9]MCH7321489.1 hypothetical protein [Solibacillus sp. MA9]